jgi:hypothetical protein
MTLPQTYPARSGSSIPLDTIANAATFFAGQWTPALKLNQSRDVLTLVLSKMYGASQGSMFHARMRCSHAALADSCSLSRVWTCELISRLRSTGWLKTSAPRLPNGKQEITTFTPGKMLKRLLIMLLRSKQRSHKRRVNDHNQKIPSTEDIVKAKAFFADLIQTLGQKLGPPGAKGSGINPG